MKEEIVREGLAEVSNILVAEAKAWTQCSQIIKSLSEHIFLWIVIVNIYLFTEDRDLKQKVKPFTKREN